MASKSPSHPLYPPGFQHHQPSVSPSHYSTDEDFGANTDDDETCLPQQDVQSLSSIRQRRKDKTSSLSRDEDNDEEEDADCIELKETLAELKSVIIGLFKKVEQNEKILKELQSASSSRYWEFVAVIASCKIKFYCVS